jgi:hypothetical protein
MRKQRKISLKPNKNCCRWEWDACNEEAKKYMAEHPKPDKKYRFSTIYYDIDEESFQEREYYDIRLTDKQYEYLLTLELCEYGYTFNDLVYDNPPFAAELVDLISDGMVIPSVILFDEVYADAKQIRNQRPWSGIIYRKDGASGLPEVTVENSTNEAHEVTLSYRNYSGWGTSEWRRICTETEGIDGKKVRKLFGGRSDREMLENIKKRFHEATAFEDLIGYLKAHRVKVNEPVVRVYY